MKLIKPLLTLIAAFVFYSHTQAATTPTQANLAIGDRVWRDDNNNGQYDPDLNEEGINGVVINLYRDADGSGSYEPNNDPFAGNTTTASDGSDMGRYVFTGLEVGDYFVHVLPSNFASGNPLEGLDSSTLIVEANNDIDNDDNGETYFVQNNFRGALSTVITLSENGEPTNDGDSNANTNLSVDFGFTSGLGNIGDRTWLDDNSNGIQDAGEISVGGVVITLESADGSIVRQTVSSAFGYYGFYKLPPGQYTITADPSVLPNAVNTADGDDTPDNSTVVFLGAGVSADNVDFGYGNVPTAVNLVSAETSPPSSRLIFLALLTTLGGLTAILKMQNR